MIILTLTNTGEYDPNDYVSVSFKLDEESTWMNIVAKLMSQGLPALGYVLPDSNEEIITRYTEGTVY